MISDFHIMQMNIEDVQKAYDVYANSISEAWSYDDFCQSVNKEYNFIYVAKKDSEIIGLIGFMVMYEESDLLFIAVDDTSRGRGIGDMLMSSMFSFLKEKQVRCITLEVRISNEKAIALYDKYGFLPITIKKKYYENPIEDAVVLQCNTIITTI